MSSAFVRFLLLVTAGFLPLFHAHAQPEGEAVREVDLLIYGGTAGGAMAGIQAARMGKSVLVLEPSAHLGGLTTSGLGATDAGKSYVVGGIAGEFYRRLYTYYEDPEKWPRESREGYFPKHFLSVTPELRMQWFFEPHVAARILDEMLAEAEVEVLLEAPLDRGNGVKMEGKRIVEIATVDGRRFGAKTFIDATYEGDLLAAAGVRFTVGREPNSLYGETRNGVRLTDPEVFAHISPFRVAGDPESGLHPRVIPLGGAVEGDGDSMVQAYNFRVCLTDIPENRVPIEKPDNYDPLTYELVLRDILGRPGIVLGPAVHTLVPMPNRKTDTNNRGFFSTDFVGHSHRWAEADYEERAEIWQAHKDYMTGFFWFLANDSRVPESIRSESARWGLAKDEFTETGNWPPALYVREGRRMVSDYVMTEIDCAGERKAEDGVTLGSYAMDSHLVNYVVDDEGRLRGDGWLERKSVPYPISYRSTLPKRGEATNLLVATCISSSHVAYGSLRMEPVFMNLGQATATAAVLAMEQDVALHDLPYDDLRARLEADGQILDADQALADFLEARQKMEKSEQAPK